jgi:hypothetical protein
MNPGPSFTYSTGTVAAGRAPTTSGSACAAAAAAGRVATVANRVTPDAYA